MKQSALSPFGPHKIAFLIAGILVEVFYALRKGVSQLIFELLVYADLISVCTKISAHLFRG